MLTKIKCSFYIQTQCSVLGYRIDLCFHDCKLATEIDRNGHCDRNTDYEIRLQKALEQELGYKFIRIDSDEEDFDIFKVVNEIFRNIK